MIIPKLSIINKHILIIFLATISSMLFGIEATFAHTPHDIIDSLEISPNYAKDKTLFITSSHKLLKSTDGGYSWKDIVNGLDHYSFLTSIIISPTFNTDQTLFVASDNDGIFKSKDGGSSWAKINSGLNHLNISLLSISLNFENDQIVLATAKNGGLYKTENGGENWHQILNDDIRITAISFHPDNKHILLGDDIGNLYLSKDEGRNWQQHTQINGSGAITSIAIASTAPLNKTVFIGTEKRGILKTTNGCATFKEMNHGLSDHSIISIALSPDYQLDNTLFSTAWSSAVFRSNNGGTTWEIHSKGITSDAQADSGKFQSPHYRDVKLPTTFGEDKTIFMGGFDGLFKSIDGGHNWEEMETLSIKLIMDMSLSIGNAENSSIAITTYGAGAYITRNQENKWDISNNGLKKARLSAVAFSPNYLSDNTIFTADNNGLLRSTNQGKNWGYISADFISKLITKIEYLIGKPKKKSPYPSVIGLSPNYASDNTVYFGTRYHGIYKSDKGGLSAKLLWNANGQFISSMVLSPNFSSDKTVFSCVRDSGVYKTTDNGNTWLPIKNGLTFVSTWQKNKNSYPGYNKDCYLAISQNYEVDRTVFAAFSKGLFKTSNGGENWQQVDEDMTNIVSINISPNFKTDKTLLLSQKGKGLFKSEDGGNSFFEIAPNLINNNHEIRFIEFSSYYATDNLIYIASEEEVFQSSDGGKTWEIISRPIRYENSTDVIRYEGDWQILKGENFSASSVSGSNVPYDKASFNFVGSGITWIGTKSHDQGIAKIYIDGNYVANVDQFTKSRENMVELYSIKKLDYGPHTITIEIDSSNNPNSSDFRIEIDAFDVLP